MVAERAVTRGWSLVQQVAGYAAASSLAVYLLVKVVGVIAALLGNQPDESDLSTVEWVFLNVVTVGIAVLGIGLALALAQPWGRRIPAAPLVLTAWVAGGFLIPMIPFMLLRMVLDGSGDGDTGGGTDALTWAGIFMTIGFTGMAMGLAIALPIYMRGRFPAAFAGRSDEGQVPRQRNLPTVRAAVTVAGILGLLWLARAFGATLGLQSAPGKDLDLTARLLMGSWGMTALLAAGSIHLITERRHRLPRWIPMVLAFTASGSLFAWNAWKLSILVISPGNYSTAEYPAVAVLEYLLAFGAGITMLVALVRAQAGVTDTLPCRSNPA